MYRLVLLAIITGLIGWSVNIGAKEINLDAGETYHQGDLTVTCGCGQSSTDPPLALNDCQYWEKFNSTCHYRTTCTFYPSQKSFVKTTCERFDDFKKTCLQTKDVKIGR